MFVLRPRLARGGLLAAFLTAALLAGCGQSHRSGTTSSTQSTGSATSTGAQASDSALRASGNHLVVGGSGTVVQLRGVNRSGTEYKCEQGGGFFDSPTPDQPDSVSMLAAMRSWDIDVVRVPLNEGCWLGSGASSAYVGPAYQKAIEAYVKELNAEGFFVILSLQWLDINGTADDEPPMADAAAAPSFWRSVATAFKSNPDVMYDLYNEPFDVSWSCWLNGCSIPAGSGSGGGGAANWPAYQAAGMQELVDAVRETGATQPLLLGGIDYALDLSGWLAHEPKDPDHNLVASVHSYGGRSPCDSTCENAIVRVSQQDPVVFGELGETDCSTSYINRLMRFGDEHGIGYLGWTWDAVNTGWSCTGGPALINSYDGEPTAYGVGFEDHFRELGPAIGPSGTGTGTGTVSAGTTSTAGPSGPSSTITSSSRSSTSSTSTGSDSTATSSPTTSTGAVTVGGVD
jgi:endoglucanase